MRSIFRSSILAFSALTFVAGAPVHAMNLDAGQQSPLMIKVADDPKIASAKAAVVGMTNKGIAFLGDDSLDDTQRTAEFRKLLNNNFDMATIGKFALGTSWRTATPAQQAEYQKLFKEMIVKTYSRRFKEYKGQKVEVGSARADGDKDVIVSSSIIPADGPEVKVDWRVRGSKIVDIMVEGVSMALTQRSDFASVIQRGGGKIDVLLEQLRAQQ